MDTETNSLVNANLNVTATPLITVLKAGNTAMPPMDTQSPGGFQFELEATLPYTVLNPVVNAALQGKRFELSEGFIKQHIVIEHCKLYSSGNQLVAEIIFAGSHTGTIQLTGFPFYNSQTEKIELQNLTYDIQTNSLLLKGVKWLFQSVILDEIKNYTAIDLKSFYHTVSGHIREVLNKQWKTGIEASGTVDVISITGVVAQPQAVLIRSRCHGSLQITIPAAALKF